MKQIRNCKHCAKQYQAGNSNQSYCCDVCRQQAYYKRHDIDRFRNYRDDYLRSQNGVKIGDVPFFEVPNTYGLTKFKLMLKYNGLLN